jgi:SAM-dependent methyltransferase
MESSEYDTIAQLEDQHWWYAGMRQIAADLVRTLPLPPHAQILDAGCGAGGGLKWLSAFGATAGIDLHPLAIHYAGRVSTRLTQGSIQQLPFAAETFDLVTSFEVLYHLAVTDDEAALSELARVLRPGGWLMVRVPAYDWLRGAHDRQVHTRQRYAPAELRQKIARSGLTLRRLTSVGLGLLLPAILGRLGQSPDQAHTDVRLPPPTLNWLLTRLLATESVWLRGFDLPAGLSLLALAQKPPAWPRAAAPADKVIEQELKTAGR